MASPHLVRLSGHFVSPGLANRLSHLKPALPPRGVPWKARSCGPSVVSTVTEADNVVATLPQPQMEEEEEEADFSTCNDRRRQRMTRRSMAKLLYTKYRTRLGTWDVRKCAGGGEAGVGVMLSKKASKSLIEWEPISDRIIKA